MSLCLFLIAAILAVIVSADPAKPVLATNYQVSDITEYLVTNTGYPPHVTMTYSNMYKDSDKKMYRDDIETTTYGTPGPYTTIYDYSETFPTECGPYKTPMDAARAYMIQKNQCCYFSLVSDCGQSTATADTFETPTFPKKVEYMGSSSSYPNVPTEADFWQNTLYLKQEVPMITNNYYIDSTDGETLLEMDTFVLIQTQFINVTTTYSGKWNVGSQDASIFDHSQYDCSKVCQGAVGRAMQVSGHQLSSKK